MTASAPPTINLARLNGLRLDAGSHENPELGMCAMEAAAWIAGEPHGDEPRCVDRHIAKLARALNDILDDDRRQRLVAYIPRVIGTSAVGTSEMKRDDDRARAYDEGMTATRHVLLDAADVERDTSVQHLADLRDQLGEDGLRAMFVRAAWVMVGYGELDGRLSTEAFYDTMYAGSETDEVHETYRAAFEAYVEALFATLDAMIDA